ncbi:MAG: TRAP transporter substrate-binding protein DctP [Candidatus Rariloculaceae bacterium]
MSEEKIKKGIDHTRRNLVASVTGMGLVAPFVAGSRFRLEEPITLRYTGHIPRSHGLYTQGFVPFAELVERETEGRLLLQSFPDRLLHGPIDGFKAVVTGITDYTHSYVTYQPGSFKLLHLPQLPFLFPSPQVGSLVVEELYPKYFKTEFERMGVYLAHCDCTSPYNLISKVPIRRLEDLNGLKLRVTGGLSSDIFHELGAVPVVIAAAEIYPAFQRGIIDAVALSVSDIAAYRLHEIGRYYTIADINVTLLHYSLNQRAFDALPQDLQVSFYRLLRVRSQLVVQNWYSGAADERAFAALREAGVDILELEESELDRWRETVAPLKERYIARYEAEGLAARAAVADMEALAKDVASLTNEQINARIRDMPTQGIIDL